jgi:hypothetical protein
MPPDAERLQQITTMRAQHDHQLRRVVRNRGSQDPAIVEDACGHAWSTLLAAEHVDLRPPRWNALAWLTSCAVRHARLLNAGDGARQPPTWARAVGDAWPGGEVGEPAVGRPR